LKLCRQPGREAGRYCSNPFCLGRTFPRAETAMAPRDNTLRRSMRRRYASLAPHRTVGSGPAGRARCRPEQFLHLRRSVAMLCLLANAGWQLVPMKSDGTNACAARGRSPSLRVASQFVVYGIGSRLAREC
jgi:hypothetical protein